MSEPLPRTGEVADSDPGPEIDRCQRLRFHAQLLGGHVHVHVWAGTARADRYPDGTWVGWLGGTRARSGDLVLRPEEWTALCEILATGFSTLAAMGTRPDSITDLVIEEDDP